MIWLVCFGMTLAATLYLVLPLWRTDRFAAVTIAVMITGGALALYVALGNPQLPGAPYEARWRNPAFAAATGDVALAEERPDEAVAAYQRAIAAGGASAGGYARLGEAIVAAHDGQVTAEAAHAFAEALSRDPKEPRARFFGGLLLMQRGNAAAAVALWLRLSQELDAKSPLQPLLQEVLRRAGAAE